MGTNYYLIKRIKCPHCGSDVPKSEDKEKHIGKSSAGWRFIFSSQLGSNFEKVIEAIFRDEYCIIDEYEKTIDKVKFLNMVLSKQNEHLPSSKENLDEFIDKYGFRFTERDFC